MNRIVLDPGRVAHQLSSRETEVLLALVSGKKPREIAAELGISVKTCGTYRERIFRKTGVKSMVELVKLAVNEGITQ